MRAAQAPVVPRPLHDERATVRALARQHLHDLDRDTVTTAIPTGTLELFLTWLCDMLADQPAMRQAAAVTGALIEPTNNPNLAYWQRMQDRDEDHGAPHETLEP